MYILHIIYLLLLLLLYLCTCTAEHVPPIYIPGISIYIYICKVISRLNCRKRPTLPAISRVLANHLVQGNRRIMPRYRINLNPFRTAVPFWGQAPLNLSGLPPKGDCSLKKGSCCTTAVRALRASRPEKRVYI